ncbi:hypothetical protein GCM10023238_21590 [Streptomyces heliomycini]
MHLPMDIEPPRNIETKAGSRWLRKRLVTLVDAVLNDIDRDGPMPNGKPHVAFEFLPELVNAVTAYSAHTLEVHRDALARKACEPDTKGAAVAMAQIAGADK